MRILDVAALAATGALLALASPSLACDYGMKHDTIAEAQQTTAPAPTAEAAQPTAPVTTATAAASTASPTPPAEAPAQTAEADLGWPPVARPN